MSSSMRLRASSCVAAFVASVGAAPSWAQSAPETVIVTAHTALDGAEINRAGTRSSDTAALLLSVAGVSTYAAGGVSGLPAIHGLGADRVNNILVDGMQTGVG